MVTCLSGGHVAHLSADDMVLLRIRQHRGRSLAPLVYRLRWSNCAGGEVHCVRWWD